LKGWQIPYFRTKVQPIGLTGPKVEIERNCYGGILWSLPNPHWPCHKDACAEVGEVMPFPIKKKKLQLPTLHRTPKVKGSRAIISFIFFFGEA